MTACRRAAHSSIFNFGQPEETEAAMPPIASTYFSNEEHYEIREMEGVSI
jgi:hypothetical protein